MVTPQPKPFGNAAVFPGVPFVYLADLVYLNHGSLIGQSADKVNVMKTAGGFMNIGMLPGGTSHLPVFHMVKLNRNWMNLTIRKFQAVSGYREAGIYF
jgi:hypothetical protein